MSKKEKQTEQTEQKHMTKYDLKMQRRKEEKEREKREALIGKITGIAVVIAVACLVLSFPLRNYLAVHDTYAVVGGEKVTRIEFDYNYYTAKNNFIAENGMYMSYFGVDLTGDLSQVMYSDTLTFEDYFTQLAVENIVRQKALLAEAKEKGFAYDTEGEYKRIEEDIKAAASEAGVTTKEFIQINYGPYATMNRISQYLKETMLVTAYYEQLAEENQPAQEEISAYYDEHKADYDSVDYRLTTISAELPTEPTELADPVDGTAAGTASGGDSSAGGTAASDTYQPSEAEIEKAMSDAKKLADEAEKTVMKDGEAMAGQTQSSVVYLLREWLFDEARKEGDTTVIENATGNSYYVVGFEKRYLDETPTADARILTAASQEEGQTYLNEWKSGEATSESFAELCNRYSQDTSVNGGLYEGLATSVYEPLSNWLFDEARAAGDTEVIALEDGSAYVAYYLKQNDPVWVLSIRNTLLTETLKAHEEAITANVTVEDPKGRLNYLKVQAAADAAADSTDDSAAADSTAADSAAADADGASGAGESTEEASQSTPQ